jgi:hypothetical protein
MSISGTKFFSVLVWVGVCAVAGQTPNSTTEHAANARTANENERRWNGWVVTVILSFGGRSPIKSKSVIESTLNLINDFFAARAVPECAAIACPEPAKRLAAMLLCPFSTD